VKLEQEHLLKKIITKSIKYKAMTKTANSKVLTTQEVAARFNELAQQEKWFEIQDEFFAENVKSIDPPNSPYFGYAEGKSPVRKKGEDYVKTDRGSS
jgi:hypothetical protein